MISETLNQMIYEITSNLQIDFVLLALSNIKQNDLWKHIIILNGKPTFDFSNQENLIKLNQSIMKIIFGISWSIDHSNLCPRIPNRLNYLIWIHKFIQPLLNDLDIKAIDIGTGSSLIYPLLGYKMFKWHFIATEIDENSVRNCQQLISWNNLENMIDLRKVESNFILKNNISKDENISFLMCNPPFFDTQQYSDPLGKMTEFQHRVSGGQYQFFFQIYMQSFNFSNIQYFTMMIGLQTDFEQIKTFLEQQSRTYNQLEMIKFGKLNQGNNTRFIIAWKPRYNLPLLS